MSGRVSRDKRSRPVGSGRPRAWPPVWSALANAAGGIDQLAALLETTRSTVQRWALGVQPPSGPARVAVRYLAAELHARSPL